MISHSKDVAPRTTPDSMEIKVFWCSSVHACPGVAVVMVDEGEMRIDSSDGEDIGSRIAPGGSRVYATTASYFVPSEAIVAEGDPAAVMETLGVIIIIMSYRINVVARTAPYAGYGIDSFICQTGVGKMSVFGPNDFFMWFSPFIVIYFALAAAARPGTDIGNAGLATTQLMSTFALGPQPVRVFGLERVVGCHTQLRHETK